MRRNADRTAWVARVGYVMLAAGALLIAAAALAGLHVYSTPVYTSTPPPTPSPGALALAADLLAPPPLPTSGPGGAVPLLLPRTELETPAARAQPTSTPSSTPSETVPPTATASPTTTLIPTRAATRTPSPTATALATASATPGATPTRTLTASPTPMRTVSATARPSSTPAPSATLTATSGVTPGATPGVTPAPSLTATLTATPTLTTTSTPTPTPTHTATASATPSASPAATITLTLSATAARHPPSRLRIPAIGLDAPVVPVGWETVTLGEQTFGRWQVPDQPAVGWHNTSAGVGEVGNTVLNGHHNRYGRVFHRLIRVQPGDEIVLVDDAAAPRGGGREYRYIVVRTMVLAEEGQPVETRMENARWILPSPDERVTLVSCWPYDGNSHRLIVVARPASAVLSASPTPPIILTLAGP